jgi:hypothetical protein
MTDRDRVKLLFGPYKAPALKRGDRATCLVCDCAVISIGDAEAHQPEHRHGRSRARRTRLTGGANAIRQSRWACTRSPLDTLPTSRLARRLIPSHLPELPRRACDVPAGLIA